ncbi:hypothetical protein PINS_up013086 [Pythium insidiosum]|nr:hypothetical protein PINS_up013086 [Pythium insidiosum]
MSCPIPHHQHQHQHQHQAIPDAERSDGASTRVSPTWSPLTTFHTATAAGVLGLSVPILLLRKGTATHRRMGRLWSGAMVATCVSSYGIREHNGGFSWIHGLSTFSLASLSASIYCIRRKNVVAHKRIMHGLLVGTLVAGFFAAATPGRLLHSQFIRKSA